jgi:hypothetical protein
VCVCVCLSRQCEVVYICGYVGSMGAYLCVCVPACVHACCMLHVCLYVCFCLCVYAYLCM